MGKGLVVAPVRRFQDFSNLRAPISWKALRAFRKALLKRWPEAKAESDTVLFWVGIAMLGQLGVILVLLPLGIALTMPVSMGNVPLMVGGVVSAVVAWLLTVAGIRIVRRELAARGGWRHWFRLTRFAAVNDLLYLPTREEWGPTSFVFSAMPPGEYRDVFVDARAPTLQFGNRVPPKLWGGLDQRVAGWAFLTVQLEADAGWMLLVPRRARMKLTRVAERWGLPEKFAQRFVLWGTLGSFADPLDVITPQLMTLLADELPGSFVEVHGRQLVITTPRPWYFDGQRSWTRIERLADAVTAGARGAGGADLATRQDAAGWTRAGFVTPPPRQPVFTRPSWLGIAFVVLIGVSQVLRVIYDR